MHTLLKQYLLDTIQLPHTVNDKSFEGEKFRGLLSSSGMRGKVSRFFPLPPSYMSELSEEQNFSRENFRGLIKIRENRESFLTVKLLSFTVLLCIKSNLCFYQKLFSGLMDYRAGFLSKKETNLIRSWGIISQTCNILITRPMPGHAAGLL